MSAKFDNVSLRRLNLGLCVDVTVYFDFLRNNVYGGKAEEKRRESGVRVKPAETRLGALLTISAARHSRAIIVNAYQTAVTNFDKANALTSRNS